VSARGPLLGLALAAVALASCSGAASSPTRSAHQSSTTSAPTTSTLGTTSTTLPPTTTTTTPAPSPTQLVEDLTWVSDTHGWALVDTPNCGQSTCTEVLTTTDGGTAWSQIGTIAASSSLCTGCGTLDVTHIRFANDLDGYAFDPNLFVTTDGGTTWSQESGPFVEAVEPAGADVMRVSYSHSGCPGPCDLTIQEAPAGASNWDTVNGPIQGDAVQLVRQGADNAYVAVFQNPAGGAGSAHAMLMISHNGGTSWTDRADPCGVVGGNEYDTSAIAAAPSSVVTILCSERGGTQRSFVAVSTNGGTTFTSQPLVAPADTFTNIAATSAVSVFLGGTAPATGAESAQWVLLASTDGGQSWQQVASQTGQAEQYFPGASFLGFESATVGRWVGYPYDIWETTDGGSTWVRQSAA
jgi:photosystem II stability/assembly factor-like uncharacterized protein